MPPAWLPCVSANTGGRAANKRSKEGSVAPCAGATYGIEAAKEQYAIEYEDTYGLAPTGALTLADLSAYGITPAIACPLLKGTAATFEASYNINSLTSPATCKVAPEDHAIPAEFATGMMGVAVGP